MKKFLIYLIPIVLLGLIAYFAFGSEEASGDTELYVEANRGDFLIEAIATGELKAKNSIKIRGPEGMRSAGIYQTNIKNMVPEGTNVKKGQFVASLDKTELATKITEIQTEIEKFNTQLEQAKIDTAIQIKNVRDEIGNLKFSMAQEKLEIEKNKFEPQMVIDQSKLKLENSERSMDQLENKIELIRIQSDAKVREIETNIKQQQNKLDQLMGISSKFNILAPEDGMVIYEKEWNGSKKGPGSQISSWDPVVAELPDLSQMNSVGYVNEVDISKIKKGQKVNIVVDAFPEKEFAGRITSVANIGQQLRNQEAKVFEIIIEIIEKDDILRPAMTTSNSIKIFEYEDVLSIPLEGFLSDSLDYVLKKSDGKIVRQQVISGPSNANNIIILEGLEEGDEVCITPVENMEEISWEYLTDEKIAIAEQKIADWEEKKADYDQKNAEEVKDEQLERKDFSGGGGMIIIG